MKTLVIILLVFISMVVIYAVVYALSRVNNTSSSNNTERENLPVISPTITPPSLNRVFFDNNVETLHAELVNENTGKNTNRNTSRRISRKITPTFGRKKSQFNGLILFDIDGTLTPHTAVYNEAIVDYCLKMNWAVGICTAGPIYSMQNLLDFPWMPLNLFRFISEHDDITFNNVISGYLCGKSTLFEYTDNDRKAPFGVNKVGYRKGLALVETGKILEIYDSTKLALCDDLELFLTGVKTFNNNVRTLCCSPMCCGQLSLSRVRNLLENEPPRKRLSNIRIKNIKSA